MFKGFITIVGNLIPAIQTSDAQTERVTLPARGDLPGRTITTQFAWFISLRENLQGEKYLAKSYEDLRFIAPRDSHVVGLDVTRDGDLLSIGDLGQMLAENQAQRQLDAQPQGVAVTAADLTD